MTSCICICISILQWGTDSHLIHWILAFSAGSLNEANGWKCNEDKYNTIQLTTNCRWQHQKKFPLEMNTYNWNTIGIQCNIGHIHFCQMLVSFMCCIYVVCLDVNLTELNLIWRKTYQQWWCKWISIIHLHSKLHLFLIYMEIFNSTLSHCNNVPIMILLLLL